MKSRYAKAVNMGTLFIGFILIIIGLALQPTIQSSVTVALVNASAMVTAVLNLVPLVWVLVVVGIGVKLVYDQFAGMD